MEQLRNLHEIGILAGKRFCTYEGKILSCQNILKTNIRDKWLPDRVS